MYNNSRGTRELTPTPDVLGGDEDELVVDTINNNAEVGKSIVETIEGGGNEDGRYYFN